MAREPLAIRLNWDPEADTILVTWDHEAPGGWSDTSDDRVLVKTDQDDNVIGFMIEGVTKDPRRSPATVALKPEGIEIADYLAAKYGGR